MKSQHQASPLSLTMALALEETLCQDKAEGLADLSGQVQSPQRRWARVGGVAVPAAAWAAWAQSLCKCRTRSGVSKVPSAPARAGYPPALGDVRGGGVLLSAPLRPSRTQALGSQTRAVGPVLPGGVHPTFLGVVKAGAV